MFKYSLFTFLVLSLPLTAAQYRRVDQQINGQSFSQVRKILLDDSLYNERFSGPVVDKIVSCTSNESAKEKLWLMYIYRMLSIRQTVHHEKGSYKRMLHPKNVYQANWKPFSKSLKEALLLSTVLAVAAGIFGGVTDNEGENNSLRFFKKSFNTQRALVGYIPTQLFVLFAGIMHHYADKQHGDFFAAIERSQRGLFQAHEKHMPEKVRKLMKQFLDSLDKFSLHLEKDKQAYEHAFVTFADTLAKKANLANN